jgi:hypothetical protein
MHFEREGQRAQARRGEFVQGRKAEVALAGDLHAIDDQPLQPGPGRAKYLERRAAVIESEELQAAFLKKNRLRVASGSMLR